MTKTEDALKAVEAALIEEQANGKWRPQPAESLRDCAFLRVGYNSYGLEAADKAWRLTVSKLDFGDRNPTALLEVHAPGHDAAFPDLADFVFNHSLGTNGGNNFNQAVKRLHRTLGGNEIDWESRITYLIARARDANAGGGNGTFSTMSRPEVPEAPPFVFAGRVREGRTISLYGPGSAGKTTLVDGLVAAACSGNVVVPGWHPRRRYACLVLDWDEGDQEERVRLAAICAAYDIELSGGFHHKRMTRPLHDVADEVGAYIAHMAIEIVVISPVGRAIRDHGDNLTAPIDELYSILRSFGTTNILIDHVTGANMKGGAEREFGSVRKRDNARGSYSIYPDEQRVGLGSRVIELLNTKPDALQPPMAPQAIRIEYEPPESRNGVYDTIRFEPDEMSEQPSVMASVALNPMRRVLHVALLQQHRSIEELSSLTAYNAGSIKTCLYRNPTWFSRLPSSNRWEALPIIERPPEDDQ